MGIQRSETTPRGGAVPGQISDDIIDYAMPMTKIDKMLREAHDLCLEGKFREAGDVVLHMGVETRMLQQTLKLMEDGPLARSSTS